MMFRLALIPALTTAACLAAMINFASVAPAFAQSALTKKVPTRAFIVPRAQDGESIPLPNTETGLENDATTDEQPEAETAPTADDEAAEPGRAAQPSGPVPMVERDFTKLPVPVRETRQRILDAVETGNIEMLRPIVGTGEEATSLSIGGNEADPIDFLKEISGDGDGIEILAILKEVLETGYVHMDEGSDFELYVWPYFFAYPLDKLTGPQKVELFTIMTAGEVLDSEEFGSYIFYRVGITPDGRWAFFVSGD
ncbi:hypothetical protein [Ahrensia sp. R2A130]|uniref:hypothetical protein n=1 Tax=Ahrensia sp. R2A130 TaxID=744979 RepID=UPI0001E0A43B|nr:hypothetical protein [Ahrensia sp. R2A130]EFL90643.1 putative cytoplasmic protein [Ahrensia sp. R2A130]